MCASHISGFRLGEFTLYLKGMEEIKFGSSGKCVEKLKKGE